MSSRSQSFTAGSPESPRRVLILHGYTGGPDEFRDLADTLLHRLDAYVSVPLLPGHGTSEEDLERYSFTDFLSACTNYVREMEQSGKPFVVIGHSFGGSLAPLAVAHASPAALVLTVTPFSLRFPFSLPASSLIARTKRFWSKKLPPQEVRERSGRFYYTRMPGIGMYFINRSNRLLRKVLPTISCPILTINNRLDPLCFPESGAAMLALSGKNSANKAVILENRKHGLFYGEGTEEVIEEIVSFLENVFKK